MGPGQSEQTLSCRCDHQLLAVEVVCEGCSVHDHTTEMSSWLCCCCAGIRPSPSHGENEPLDAALTITMATFGFVFFPHWLLQEAGRPSLVLQQVAGTPR